MMTGVPDVQRGDIGDAAAVQELMAEARDWLSLRGVDQWRGTAPDTLLERDAELGCLFVVRVDGAVVAAVTLYDTDPDVWGDDESAALYVHRLVVGRSHRSLGLGLRMMAWVGLRAEQVGVAVVRLDCATENTFLRAFYERQGFTYVRDTTVTSMNGERLLSTSLYEIPADVLRTNV